MCQRLLRLLTTISHSLGPRPEGNGPWLPGSRGSLAARRLGLTSPNARSGSRRLPRQTSDITQPPSPPTVIAPRGAVGRFGAGGATGPPVCGWSRLDYPPFGGTAWPAGLPIIGNSAGPSLHTGRPTRGLAGEPAQIRKACDTRGWQPAVGPSLPRISPISDQEHAGLWFPARRGGRADVTYRRSLHTSMYTPGGAKAWMPAAPISVGRGGTGGAREPGEAFIACIRSLHRSPYDDEWTNARDQARWPGFPVYWILPPCPMSSPL